MANLNREFTSWSDCVSTSVNSSLTASAVGTVLQVGLQAIVYLTEDNDEPATLKGFIEYVKPTVAGCGVGALIGTGLGLVTNCICYGLKKK